jgi:hypothetical protein
MFRDLPLSLLEVMFRDLPLSLLEVMSAMIARCKARDRGNRTPSLSPPRGRFEAGSAGNNRNGIGVEEA